MFFNKAKKQREAEIKKLAEELITKRELPVGLTSFHEWSERIIKLAALPSDPGADINAFYNSQKFALANDLMHLNPNSAFESDAYFAHRLRKYAVNQVADQVRQDIKAARDAKNAIDAAKQNEADATPIGASDGKVLAINQVRVP